MFDLKKAFQQYQNDFEAKCDALKNDIEDAQARTTQEKWKQEFESMKQQAADGLSEPFKEFLKDRANDKQQQQVATTPPGELSTDFQQFLTERKKLV